MLSSPACSVSLPSGLVPDNLIADHVTVNKQTKQGMVISALITLRPIHVAVGKTNTFLVLVCNPA
jgi:hypothetical protein